MRAWPVALVCLSAALLVAPPDGAASQTEQVAPGSAPVVPSRAIRGLQADIADLILHGESGGALRLQALAVPGVDVSSDRSVAVLIEIEGAALLREQIGSSVRTDVYVYAVRASRAVAAYSARAITVDTDRWGERLWESGLKLQLPLELEPGSYTLHILVRSTDSGGSPRHGLLRLPLVQPDAASSAPVAFAVDSSERDAWIAVELGDQAREQYRPELDRAAAQAIFVVGRQSQLQLFGEAQPTAEGRCRVQLLEGVGPESQNIETETACRVEPGGPTGSQVVFKTPRLDPGEYGLRVLLGASVPATPPIPVAIVRSGSADRNLRWTDLRWLEHSEERPDPSRGVGGRRLAARYRAALELYASGAAPAAEAAIVEIESELLGRSSERLIADLSAAEQTVVAELAARDPESLMPLLTLHSRLYRGYLKRRQFSLAALSKETVQRLVQVYVESGGSASVAAQALTSLGGFLQTTMPTSSEALFRRALQHNPEEVAALLALGSMHEKLARHDQAVSVLERATALEPQAAEARLRLAHGLCRTGRGDRCQAELRAVLETPSSDWVRSLAHESLARILLDEGRLAEAEQSLRPAMHDLAPPFRPHLLLAHIYDRSGRHEESLELVRAATSVVGDLESPRFIYDSWPRSELDRVRGALASLEAQRLPRLARALSPTGAGQP